MGTRTRPARHPAIALTATVWVAASLACSEPTTPLPLGEEGPCRETATETCTAPPPRGEEAADDTWLVPFAADNWGCVAAELPGGWRCEDFLLDGVPQGAFLWRHQAGADAVVAAPHGWYDADTDAIVANLLVSRSASAQVAPVWSAVIAYSFRGNAPSGWSHNVNRPTEQDNDTCAAAEDPEFAPSRQVFDAFMQHISQVAGDGTPKLYVEIHGQSGVGRDALIDVATARVDLQGAQAIHAIMSEELAAAQGAAAGVRVAIEPLHPRCTDAESSRDDCVYWTADQTKACGSLGHVSPSPALHIELPPVLRRSESAQRTAVSFLEASLQRIAEAL